jgi:hypothetical protein
MAIALSTLDIADGGDSGLDAGLVEVGLKRSHISFNTAVNVSLISDLGNAIIYIYKQKNNNIPN